MKPAGSLVTLRIDWSGEAPNVHDCLVTNTGRRYEILEFKGKRFRCLVLDKYSLLKEGAQHYRLTWHPRRKRIDPRKM